LADKKFSSFIDDKGQLKIAKPYTEQNDGFTLKDDLNLIGRAFLHRTAWGSAVRVYQENALNEFDNEDYSWVVDPTIPDYIKSNYPYIVAFSKSPQESRLKINRFQQTQKDKERTLFNITSIASEVLTDPVSIALMSGPVKATLFGVNRVRQTRNSLLAINVEEGIKQIEDENRSITDAVVVAGVSVVINKLTKRFSKYNTDKDIIDLGKYHRSVHSEIPTSVNNKNNVANKNVTENIINKEIAARKNWSLQEHVDNIYTKIKKEYGDLDIATSPVNKFITTTVGRVLNKGKEASRKVTDFIRIMKNEYPDLNIITEKGFGKTRADGKYVPAFYNDKTKTMTLDIDGIKQMYKEGRPFKVNYIDGKKIIPFKKTDFQNADEFVDFVMRHEYLHIKMRPLKGELKATYENRINQIAYKQISNKSEGSGKNVMYYPKTGVLHVDIQQIKKEWSTGAWINNHRFFDKKLPKDTFKDIGEWIEFNIRRELVSRKIVFNQKVKNIAEFRKAQINKYTFEDLKNARLVNKSGSTALNDSQIQQAVDINKLDFDNTLANVADELLERKPSMWRMDKWGLSPLDKIFGKSSRNAKEFILNLTKEDLFLKFNKEVASPDSVESIQNTLFLPRLYDSISKLQTNYIAYVKEVTGKDIKYAKQFFLSQLGDKPRKSLFNNEAAIKYEDFQTEIYKTINQGLRSDTTGVLNKWIINSSNDLNNSFFKKYADEIKSTGVYIVPFIKRDDYLQSALRNVDDKGKYFDKQTNLQWTVKEIEEKIKFNNKAMLEATGLVDNYVNQAWRRIGIESDWEGFVSIIMPRMIQLKFDEKMIADILLDFKQYNPFRPPPSIVQKTTEGLSYKLKNAPVSKFLKNRSLILDDLTRNKLIEKGFLETDMEKLMHTYYRSMSPEIIMTLKYGDPAGYGWFYKKGDSRFAPGLMQVSEEYDLLIQGAKSNSAKKMLLEERNEIVKRLEDMRDMRKGQFGIPDNPHSIFSSVIRNFKLWAMLSTLTGAAQIVDVARIATVGGMFNNFGKMFDSYTKGFMPLFRKGVVQGQKSGQIYDLLLQYTRAQILSGNDLFQGSMKGLEGKLQQLNAMNFQYIMPMNPLTYISKTMASIHGGDDLVEMIMRVSKNKATQKDVDFLNQKGISIENAIKMGDEIKIYSEGKFGNKGDYNKITMANSDLWKDANLTFKFNKALNEYIDEIIITPSDGSAPLIANTEIGGAWLQFKKFGIDMHRKVLIKGLQRKDGKLLEDVVALTALGMLVDAARSPALNQDYSKKPLRSKILDGAERGGAFGIFTDINRLIESLSDNQIGINPILGTGKKYDTSISNKLGSVGGPSASIIGNVAEILNDWGRGRHTHHTARRLRKLVPLNKIWYMDNLMDSSEKVMY
jgi:hypothetical protein